MLLLVRWMPTILELRRALMARDRDVIAHAQHMDDVIRELPIVRDSLVARRLRLARLDSAALDGATTAVGAASLAEMLTDAAAMAKAELGPVQLVSKPLDSMNREGLTRVSVRASMSGNTEAVLTFLAILEQGPTLVNVRELTIERGVAQQPSSGTGLRADVLVDALVKTTPTLPQR